LIRLNYKRNKIAGEYLNYCLNTHEAKEFYLRVKTDGINQSNINAKILATFQIPLPPIDVQQDIVSQIQTEQRLVNANKELIEIFEQKIKDRIAKVWGEKKKEYVMEDETLSMVAED
jgi:restriction endonuclease S subunit